MIWVGVLCTFPTIKGGILTQSLGFLYQKGAASTVKPAKHKAGKSAEALYK